MFEQINKIIEHEEIITPIKFMEISDEIYAGILPNQEFKKLDKNKYFKVTSGNGLTVFKAKSFVLKENYVIFCHTLFIDSLFEHLENINELKNIKLITSQTDVPITKNLFDKKPKCISQWFSINIAHIDSNLIPIPLGIVGHDNKKNLTSGNLNKINLDKKREDKIYVNFNLNTNYFHRIIAVKKVLKIKDAIVEKPNMELNEYVKKLSNYKYSITPWGNGVDTHRMWESIYSGCVPITQNHTAFRNIQDLPIIFVDSYKEISKEMLRNYNFENINYEKLKFSWWFDLIQKQKIEEQSKEISFYENEKKNYENVNLFYSKYHKNEKSKKYATFFRKVHKKIFGRNINNKIGI